MIKFRLFLKKVTENKLYMVFHIMIFAIGLFLSALFLTLGFNTVSKMNNWFEQYPNYTVLSAELNQNAQEDFGTKSDSRYRKAATRSGSERLIQFCGIQTELFVTEYTADSDAVFYEKNLLAGTADRKDGSIWIGKSVLDTLELQPKDVIGKEVLLANTGVHIISGVFDDTDEIVSASCIVYADDSFVPQVYFLDVNHISNVKQIAQEFTDAGYKVYSHVEEITLTQNYIRMIELAAFGISLFVLIVSAIILYNTLKLSITDMYAFIALLKAIGYRSRSYYTLIFAESFTVLSGAAIVTSALYWLGMTGIKSLMIHADVQELFGYSLDELFVIRFETLGICVMFATAAVVVVALLCVKNTSQKQVYEILFEVNQ